MTGQLAVVADLTGHFATTSLFHMAKTRSKADKETRMGVSEFKARCLGIIDQLDARGGRIVITKRGREVAELRATTPKKKQRFFGSLRGKLKLKGDIVRFETTDLWDVLR